MSSEFNFPTNAFGYVPGTIPAKIIYADTAPTNPVEALFWMNTAPGDAQGTLSIRTSIVDAIPTWVTLNSEGLLRAQLELLTSTVPIAGVPAQETAQFGFFSDGVVLRRKNHMVIAADGQAWFWRGALPKTVVAGATPESSGGIGTDKWQKIITAFDSGNFQTGFTATTANQFFLWPTSIGGDGKRYTWGGSFPKIVPANSSPASTGGIGENAWLPTDNAEQLLNAFISSVAGLRGIEFLVPTEGLVQTVSGIHTDSFVGGGSYVYFDSIPYSQHSAVCIAKEALDAYDGTHATWQSVLDFVGIGNGCYVRQDIVELTDFMFGALDDLDNGFILKKLIKYSVGKYWVNQARNLITDVLVLPDNTDIRAGGGYIKNIGTISTLRQAVFMAGHWHPIMYGQRPVGSTAPYTRQVTRYRANAVVSKKSTSVVLATASHAANFVPEALYVLVTDESAAQTSTGVDIDLPANSSVVKCKSSNPATGLVEFYDSVDFGSPTAPWLCKLIDGATDQSFQIYLAQNIKLTGIVGYGRSLLSLASCVYNLNCDTWYGHYSYVIQLNGLVNSRMKGFLGTFDLGAIEIKFCTNRAKVHDFVATCLGNASAASVGMVGYGEGAKNLKIFDFEIFAPNYNPPANPLLQIQTGVNCSIFDGVIYAPNCERQPIQFYSDSRARLNNCHVYDVTLHTASRLGVRMGGNYAAYTPINCSAKRIKIYSSYAGGDTKYLVRFEHSDDCEISDCFSPDLNVLDVLNGSVRPICENNITGISGALTGANSGLLGVRNNRTLDASGYLPLGTDKRPRSSFGTNSAPACSVEAVGSGRFLGQDTPASGSGVEAGYDAGNAVGYVQARNRATSAYLPLRIFGEFVDMFLNTFQAIRFSVFGSPARFDVINSTSLPEGVISAPIGSICIAKVSGAASFWFKSGGGSGNTGWKELAFVV